MENNQPLDAGHLNYGIALEELRAQLNWTANQLQEWNDELLSQRFPTLRESFFQVMQDVRSATNLLLEHLTSTITESSLLLFQEFRESARSLIDTLDLGKGGPVAPAVVERVITFAVRSCDIARKALFQISKVDTIDLHFNEELHNTDRTIVTGIRIQTTTLAEELDELQKNQSALKEQISSIGDLDEIAKSARQITIHLNSKLEQLALAIKAQEDFSANPAFANLRAEYQKSYTNAKWIIGAISLALGIFLAVAILDSHLIAQEKLNRAATLDNLLNVAPIGVYLLVSAALFRLLCAQIHNAVLLKHRFHVINSIIPMFGSTTDDSVRRLLLYSACQTILGMAPTGFVKVSADNVDRTTDITSIWNNLFKT